jgi:hypothetical protein
MPETTGMAIPSIKSERNRCYNIENGIDEPAVKPAKDRNLQGSAELQYQ